MEHARGMASSDDSGGIPRLSARLPVPIEKLVVRSSLDPSAPAAAFLSQLIAEREHLPPQRERRRAPVSAALLSYRGAAILTPPRLPPGYRKSLVA
jgi:hypothetical protein